MNKNALMIKKNMPAILTGLICIVAFVVIMAIPNQTQAPASVNLSEYSSVSAICELATLRSYYHNVAIYEEKLTGIANDVSTILTWPFTDLIRPGYKHFWMEYNGIAEIGIDASLIQINPPDAKGVVEVYVPDAKVLTIDADRESISEPIDETGFLVSISGTDRAKAYADAQDAMRREAENDQALLDRAKNNAKLLLERYIVNIGREMGVDYTVRWIDNPR